MLVQDHTIISLLRHNDWSLFEMRGPIHYFLGPENPATARDDGRPCIALLNDTKLRLHAGWWIREEGSPLLRGRADRVFSHAAAADMDLETLIGSVLDEAEAMHYRIDLMKVTPTWAAQDDTIAIALAQRFFEPEDAAEIAKNLILPGGGAPMARTRMELMHRLHRRLLNGGVHMGVSPEGRNRSTRIIRDPVRRYETSCAIWETCDSVWGVA